MFSRAITTKYCEYSTNIKANFSRHIITRHRDKIDKSCIINHQNDNIDIQKNNNLTTCSKCGKKLSSKNSLNKHIIICKGVSNPLECHICHKIFAHRNSKNFHIKKCKVMNTDLMEQPSEEVVVVVPSSNQIEVQQPQPQIITQPQLQPVQSSLSDARLSTIEEALRSIRSGLSAPAVQAENALNVALKNQAEEALRSLRSGLVSDAMKMNKPIRLPEEPSPEIVAGRSMFRTTPEIPGRLLVPQEDAVVRFRRESMVPTMIETPSEGVGVSSLASDEGESISVSPISIPESVSSLAESPEMMAGPSGLSQEEKRESATDLFIRESKGKVYTAKELANLLDLSVSAIKNPFTPAGKKFDVPYGQAVIGGSSAAGKQKLSPILVSRPEPGRYTIIGRYQ